MNDVSIFIWNLIILFFDFVFGIFLFAYEDVDYEKFYERVRQCIYIFIGNLTVFVITIKRVFSYTGYIWGSANNENATGWQIINLIISWLPFVLTILLFLLSLLCFFELFSYGSYAHDGNKVFCSLKTIKLITGFSNIEYNDDWFYYESKDGKKIYLCFSPIVYIILCFYAHRSDRNLSKIVQRKENREKEQELYNTLIADLEKIKKENEEKSSEYFQKALDNISKIKH